jgi:hypothetical protein
MITSSVLLCILMAASCLFAQVSSTTGAIRGLVIDPSQASVPKATVRLKNAALAIERQAISSEEGEFLFALVPPASGYQIEIEAAGFHTKSFTGLTVLITEVLEVNAQLELSTASFKVEVDGGTQVLQTANPTLGGTLDSRVVSSLPLNTRNVLQLLATDAGVTARPGSTTLFVAGNRSTFNNYTLSGVDANNWEWNSLGQVPVPNPEAVQEVRTQTSLFDATTGRGSGGNISLITRSGTTQIHGSVYGFHRHNQLAANGFFANRSGFDRPFFLRTEFGASLGGPLPGKKTFWFVNYNGQRQRNATSVSTSLPVLPQERDASSLGAAFDLPASAIDPVAVRLLNLPGPFGGWLVPSGTLAPLGRFGRYFYSTTAPFSANQGTAKIDRDFQLRGRQNRLSFNLFANASSSFSPIGGNSLGLATGSAFDSQNHSLSVNDVQILNPRWINDLTLGATVNITDGNNAVRSPKVTDIGMHRFNQNIYPQIPSFSILGQIAGLGPDPNMSPRQHTPSITARDMMAYGSGRHSLRFGGETRMYQFNYRQGYKRQGSLFFSNLYANQLYSRGSENSGFRDFLIGAPSSYSINSGVDDRAFRAQDYALFFQDDFRLTRRLTLNLGLRYDAMSQVVEKRDRIGNFDASLVPAEAAQSGGPGLLQGFVFPEGLRGFGTPGVSRSTLLGEDRNNLSPRAGFAYDLFGQGRIAIRGGYGLYPVRLSAIPALQLTGQPPYETSVSFNGFQGAGRLADPFPKLPLPEEFPILPRAPRLLRIDSSGAPVFDAPLLSVSSFDRRLRTPYSHHYNLTVQASLHRQWLVEVGGIRQLERKLLFTQSTNIGLLRNDNNPGPFGLATNSWVNMLARAPIVGFGGITVFSNLAYSSYHGLLLTVTHRSSRGYLKAAYTFSKSIDNDSGGFNFDLGGTSANQFLPDSGRGLSDFDVRHRWIITYVHDLPAPSRGLARRALGGWSVAGMTTLMSNFPYSVFQNTGGMQLTAAGYGSMIKGCQPFTAGSVKERLDRYMNPQCFFTSPLLDGGAVFGPLSPFEGPGDQMYSITPGGSGRLMGSLGRNIFRGPFQQRWDLALERSFLLRFPTDAAKVECTGPPLSEEIVRV